MEFIKQGVADGEVEFEFAKHSNGTLKEVKGALGGLRTVDGQQNEQMVKQKIAQENWDLYLVGGECISHGSSCHAIPPPAHCEALDIEISAAATQPAIESV